MNTKLSWMTLLLAGATVACGGGGIPKAKYDALQKKYEQLRLENSGECATACGDCNDKVRRLEAELAQVKGAQPRRAAPPPGDPPPRAEPPPRRADPPPVAARPPERRAPPERRPPPARPPRPDPPAADPPAPDDTVSHGLATNLNEWTGSIGEGLSTIGVLRAVLAQKEKFRRCYKKALKRRPGLKATVTLHFKVTSKGKVRKLKDKSPKVRGRKLRRVMRKLSRCVRRVMKKVSFPSPYGDQSVAVVYPIKYQP